MKSTLKKITAAIILSCICYVPLSSQAYSYPKHLYGNDQIQLAWGHMGTGAYIDKTSVVNEIYDPPYYKLAANVIHYDWDMNKEYSVETKYYEYNTNTGAIYITSPRGTWGPYYDRPRTNTSSNQRSVEEAKIVWKTVYGMNWKW